MDEVLDEVLDKCFLCLPWQPSWSMYRLRLADRCMMPSVLSRSVLGWRRRPPKKRPPCCDPDPAPRSAPLPRRSAPLPPRQLTPDPARSLSLRSDRSPPLRWFPSSSLQGRTRVLLYSSTRASSPYQVGTSAGGFRNTTATAAVTAGDACQAVQPLPQQL